MVTVADPVTITPPWAVRSPKRAACIWSMKTVGDPSAMVSGGPLQDALSPTLAAGLPSTVTVGEQGGKMGPPTCLGLGQV